MTAAVFDDRLFADAVMARVATESLPTPARALRAALRTRDLGLAGGAVWTAWHLTTSRTLLLRTGARLRNAALLAVLLLLLAISTVVAAAGATVVVRTFIDRPSPMLLTTPDLNLAPPAGEDNGVHGFPVPATPPDHQATPTPTGHHPDKSPDADNPGDSNGGSHGGPGPSPTPTPRGHDDGGNSGGDDHDSGGDDGSGSGGDHEDSPEPTDQPEATEAPEPTDGPDDGDDGGDDDGGDSTGGDSGGVGVGD